MTTPDTIAFLGGTEVFSSSVVSELDLAAQVARGFPSAPCRIEHGIFA